MVIGPSEAIVTPCQHRVAPDEAVLLWGFVVLLTVMRGADTLTEGDNIPIPLSNLHQ